MPEKIKKTKSIYCLLGLHNYKVYEVTKWRSKRETVSVWIFSICPHCHNEKMELKSVLGKKEVKQIMEDARKN